MPSVNFEPPKNAMRCAKCKCVLDWFTGKHIIAKDGKQQTVCGLCKSQLEVDGWKEIAAAK